jgi:hypothetical protein
MLPLACVSTSVPVSNSVGSSNSEKKLLAAAMPFGMVTFTSVKDRMGLAIIAELEMKAIKPLCSWLQNAGDMAR